jgi:hypothetical protein
MNGDDNCDDVLETLRDVLGSGLDPDDYCPINDPTRHQQYSVEYK